MSSSDITMVRGAKLPNWPTFLYSAVVIAPVSAFAFWTIASHVCVIFRLPFYALAKGGPMALGAGLALGIYVARLGYLPGPEVDGTESPPRQVPWKSILVPVLALAAHPFGISYQAFWFICVLFLLWVLSSSHAHGQDPERQEPRIRRQISGKDLSILLVLALASGGLTFCAHRPDADDATYVGLAADAVAHPDLPALSHDVLYGGDRLPLILPTYAVDSYELLAAAFSRWFGGAPIWWMHAFIPTAIALLLPFAWAELMGTFAPRQWVGAAALALLVLALLGESHYSLGNFAFVRLFQGKAVLATAGIPLLFSWSCKIQERRHWVNWVLLLACTIACVGLSAIALFVVPITLGIAALGSWNFKNTLSSALVLVPALYPLCWALALRRNFQSVAHAFEVPHLNAQGMVAQVFGAHGQYVIWLGLLCAPLLAPPLLASGNASQPWRYFIRLLRSTRSSLRLLQELLPRYRLGGFSGVSRSWDSLRHRWYGRLRPPLKPGDGREHCSPQHLLRDASFTWHPTQVCGEPTR